ncbi:MAG TPA: hypothetical protein PKV84_04220, partial [Candidatus Omnitrophota bacterium]|nr:hypothetical protein [Candidatus Omnitrophota bacterium]
GEGAVLCDWLSHICWGDGWAYFQLGDDNEDGTDDSFVIFGSPRNVTTGEGTQIHNWTLSGDQTAAYWDGISTMGDDGFHWTGQWRVTADGDILNGQVLYTYQNSVYYDGDHQEMVYYYNAAGDLIKVTWDYEYSDSQMMSDTEVDNEGTWYNTDCADGLAAFNADYAANPNGDWEQNDDGTWSLTTKDICESDVTWVGIIFVIVVIIIAIVITIASWGTGTWIGVAMVAAAWVCIAVAIVCAAMMIYSKLTGDDAFGLDDTEWAAYSVQFSCLAISLGAGASRLWSSTFYASLVTGFINALFTYGMTGDIGKAITVFVLSVVLSLLSKWVPSNYFIVNLIVYFVITTFVYALATYLTADEGTYDSLWDAVEDVWVYCLVIAFFMALSARSSSQTDGNAPGKTDSTAANTRVNSLDMKFNWGQGVIKFLQSSASIFFDMIMASDKTDKLLGDKWGLKEYDEDTREYEATTAGKIVMSAMNFMATLSYGSPSLTLWNFASGLAAALAGTYVTAREQESLENTGMKDYIAQSLAGQIGGVVSGLVGMASKLLQYAIDSDVRATLKTNGFSLLEFLRGRWDPATGKLQEVTIGKNGLLIVDNQFFNKKGDVIASFQTIGNEAFQYAEKEAKGAYAVDAAFRQGIAQRGESALTIAALQAGATFTLSKDGKLEKTSFVSRVLSSLFGDVAAGTVTAKFGDLSVTLELTEQGLLSYDADRNGQLDVGSAAYTALARIFTNNDTKTYEGCENLVQDLQKSLGKGDLKGVVSVKFGVADFRANGQAYGDVTFLVSRQSVAITYQLAGATWTAIGANFQGAVHAMFVLDQALVEAGIGRVSDFFKNMNFEMKDGKPNETLSKFMKFGDYLSKNLGRGESITATFNVKYNGKDYSLSATWRRGSTTFEFNARAIDGSRVLVSFTFATTTDAMKAFMAIADFAATFDSLVFSKDNLGKIIAFRDGVFGALTKAGLSTDRLDLTFTKADGTSAGTFTVFADPGRSVLFKGATIGKAGGAHLVLMGEAVSFSDAVTGLSELDTVLSGFDGSSSGMQAAIRTLLASDSFKLFSGLALNFMQGNASLGAVMFESVDGVMTGRFMNVQVNGEKGSVRLGGRFAADQGGVDQAFNRINGMQEKLKNSDLSGDNAEQLAFDAACELLGTEGIASEAERNAMGEFGVTLFEKQTGSSVTFLLTNLGDGMLGLRVQLDLGGGFQITSGTQYKFSANDPSARQIAFKTGSDWAAGLQKYDVGDRSRGSKTGLRALLKDAAISWKDELAAAPVQGVERVAGILEITFSGENNTAFSRLEFSVQNGVISMQYFGRILGNGYEDLTYSTTPIEFGEGHADISGVDFGVDLYEGNLQFNERFAGDMKALGLLKDIINMPDKPRLDSPKDQIGFISKINLMLDSQGVLQETLGQEILAFVTVAFFAGTPLDPMGVGADQKQHMTWSVYDELGNVVGHAGSVQGNTLSVNLKTQTATVNGEAFSIKQDELGRVTLQFSITDKGRETTVKGVRQEYSVLDLSAFDLSTQGAILTQLTSMGLIHNQFELIVGGELVVAGFGAEGDVLAFYTAQMKKDGQVWVKSKGDIVTLTPAEATTLLKESNRNLYNFLKLESGQNVFLKPASTLEGAYMQEEQQAIWRDLGTVGITQTTTILVGTTLQTAQPVLYQSPGMGQNAWIVIGGNGNQYAYDRTGQGFEVYSDKPVESGVKNVSGLSSGAQEAVAGIPANYKNATTQGQIDQYAQVTHTITDSQGNVLNGTVLGKELASVFGLYDTTVLMAGGQAVWQFGGTKFDALVNKTIVLRGLGVNEGQYGVVNGGFYKPTANLLNGKAQTLAGVDAYQKSHPEAAQYKILNSHTFTDAKGKLVEDGTVLDQTLSNAMAQITGAREQIILMNAAGQDIGWFFGSDITVLNQAGAVVFGMDMQFNANTNKVEPVGKQGSAQVNENGTWKNVTIFGTRDRIAGTAALNGGIAVTVHGTDYTVQGEVSTEQSLAIEMALNNANVISYEWRSATASGVAFWANGSLNAYIADNQLWVIAQDRNAAGQAVYFQPATATIAGTLKTYNRDEMSSEQVAELDAVIAKDPAFMSHVSLTLSGKGTTVTGSEFYEFTVNGELLDPSSVTANMLGSMGYLTYNNETVSAGAGKIFLSDGAALSASFAANGSFIWAQEGNTTVINGLYVQSGKMSLGANHALVASGSEIRVVGSDGVVSYKKSVSVSVNGIAGRTGNDLAIDGEIAFSDGTTNYLLGFNGTQLVAGLRGTDTLSFNMLNAATLMTGNITNIAFIQTQYYTYSLDRMQKGLFETDLSGKRTQGWNHETGTMLVSTTNKTQIAEWANKAQVTGASVNLEGGGTMPVDINVSYATELWVGAGGLAFFFAGSDEIGVFQGALTAGSMGNLSSVLFYAAPDGTYSLQRQGSALYAYDSNQNLLGAFDVRDSKNVVSFKWDTVGNNVIDFDSKTEGAQKTLTLQSDTEITLREASHVLVSAGTDPAQTMRIFLDAEYQILGQTLGDIRSDLSILFFKGTNGEMIQRTGAMQLSAFDASGQLLGQKDVTQAAFEQGRLMGEKSTTLHRLGTSEKAQATIRAYANTARTELAYLSGPDSTLAPGDAAKLQYGLYIDNILIAIGEFKSWAKDGSVLATSIHFTGLDGTEFDGQEFLVLSGKSADFVNEGFELSQTRQMNTVRSDPGKAQEAAFPKGTNVSYDGGIYAAVVRGERRIENISALTSDVTLQGLISDYYGSAQFTLFDPVTGNGVLGGTILDADPGEGQDFRLVAPKGFDIFASQPAGAEAEGYAHVLLKGAALTATAIGANLVEAGFNETDAERLTDLLVGRGEIRAGGISGIQITDPAVVNEAFKNILFDYVQNSSVFKQMFAPQVIYAGNELYGIISISSPADRIGTNGREVIGVVHLNKDNPEVLLWGGFATSGELGKNAVITMSAHVFDQEALKAGSFIILAAPFFAELAKAEFVSMNWLNSFQDRIVSNVKDVSLVQIQWAGGFLRAETTVSNLRDSISTGAGNTFMVRDFQNSKILDSKGTVEFSYSANAQNFIIQFTQSIAAQNLVFFSEAGQHLLNSMILALGAGNVDLSTQAGFDAAARAWRDVSFRQEKVEPSALERSYPGSAADRYALDAEPSPFESAFMAETVSTLAGTQYQEFEQALAMAGGITWTSSTGLDSILAGFHSALGDATVSTTFTLTPQKQNYYASPLAQPTPEGYNLSVRVNNISNLGTATYNQVAAFSRALGVNVTADHLDDLFGNNPSNLSLAKSFSISFNPMQTSISISATGQLWAAFDLSAQASLVRLTGFAADFLAGVEYTATVFSSGENQLSISGKINGAAWDEWRSTHSNVAELQGGIVYGLAPESALEQDRWANGLRTKDGRIALSYEFGAEFSDPLIGEASFELTHSVYYGENGVPLQVDLRAATGGLFSDASYTSYAISRNAQTGFFQVSISGGDLGANDSFNENYHLYTREETNHGFTTFLTNNAWIAGDFHCDLENGSSWAEYHDYAAETFQAGVISFQQSIEKATVSIQLWTSTQWNEGHYGKLVLAVGAIAVGFAAGGWAIAAVTGTGAIAVGMTAVVIKNIAWGVIFFSAFAAVSVAGGIVYAEKQKKLVTDQDNPMDPWQAAIQISNDSWWLHRAQNYTLTTALFFFATAIGTPLMNLGLQNVVVHSWTSAVANFFNRFTSSAFGKVITAPFRWLFGNVSVEVIAQKETIAALSRFAGVKALEVGARVSLTGANAFAVHLMRFVSIKALFGSAIHLGLTLPFQMNIAANLISDIFYQGQVRSVQELEATMLSGGWSSGRGGLLGVWDGIKKSVAMMFSQSTTGSGLSQAVQQWSTPEFWVFVAAFHFLSFIPTYSAAAVGRLGEFMLIGPAKKILGGFVHALGSVFGSSVSIGLANLQAGVVSFIWGSGSVLWQSIKSLFAGVYEEVLKEPVLQVLLLSWLPSSAQEYVVELLDAADGDMSHFISARMGALSQNLQALGAAAPQAIKGLSVGAQNDVAARLNTAMIAFKAGDYTTAQTKLAEALNLIGSQKTGNQQFDGAVRNLQAMQATQQGVLNRFNAALQDPNSALVKQYSTSVLSEMYSLVFANPFMDLGAVSSTGIGDFSGLAAVAAISLKLSDPKVTINIKGMDAKLNAVIAKLQKAVEGISDPQARQARINALVANLAINASALTYTDAQGQSHVNEQVLANAVLVSLAGAVTAEALTSFGISQRVIDAYGSLEGEVQAEFRQALSERIASADENAIVFLMIGAQLKTGLKSIAKAESLAGKLGVSWLARGVLAQIATTEAQAKALGEILIQNAGSFEFSNLLQFQGILTASVLLQTATTKEQLVAAFNVLGITLTGDLLDAFESLMTSRPDFLKDVAGSLVEFVRKDGKVSARDIRSTVLLSVFRHGDKLSKAEVMKVTQAFGQEIAGLSTLVQELDKLDESVLPVVLKAIALNASDMNLTIEGVVAYSLKVMGGMAVADVRTSGETLKTLGVFSDDTVKGVTADELVDDYDSSRGDLAAASKDYLRKKMPAAQQVTGSQAVPQTVQEAELTRAQNELAAVNDISKLDAGTAIGLAQRLAFAEMLVFEERSKGLNQEGSTATKQEKTETLKTYQDAQDQYGKLKSPKFSKAVLEAQAKAMVNWLVIHGGRTSAVIQQRAQYMAAHPETGPPQIIWEDLLNELVSVLPEASRAPALELLRGDVDGALGTMELEAGHNIRILEERVKRSSQQAPNAKDMRALSEARFTERAARMARMEIARVFARNTASAEEITLRIRAAESKLAELQKQSEDPTLAASVQNDLILQQEQLISQITFFKRIQENIRLNQKGGVKGLSFGLETKTYAFLNERVTDHEAGANPILLKYTTKPKTDGTALRVIRAETSESEYRKVAKYAEMSPEQLAAVIELAKLYNQTIEMWEAFVGWDIASRNQVEQGVAIANLIFSPNLFHEIPTGTGKTSTIFASLMIFHKAFKQRAEQLKSEKAGTQTLAEMQKLYKNSDGRLIFILPDLNLFEQTEGDIKPFAQGGLKFAYFTEKTLDALRTDEAKGVIDEFQSADVVIVLNQAAAFLQLNKQASEADYKRKVGAPKIAIERFYDMFMTNNRVLADEADTWFTQPPSQMGEGERLLGKPGFEYEIEHSALIDQAIMGVVGEGVSGLDALEAQRRMLTVSVVLEKGGAPELMSWEEWQKKGAPGQLLDARIDGVRSKEGEAAIAAISKALVGMLAKYGITADEGTVKSWLLQSPQEFEQLPDARIKEIMREARASLVGRAKAIRQREGGDVAKYMRLVPIKKNEALMKVFTGREDLEGAALQLMLHFNGRPEALRDIANGKGKSYRDGEILYNKELREAYDLLVKNDMLRYLDKFAPRWTIAVVSNKTINPRLQMSDPYLNAHTQLVFLRAYGELGAALGTIDGASKMGEQKADIKTSEGLDRFLRHVTVSGNATHSTQEEMIRALKMRGSTLGGFSGTLGHVRSGLEKMYGARMLRYVENNPYFGALSGDEAALISLSEVEKVHAKVLLRAVQVASELDGASKKTQEEYLADLEGLLKTLQASPELRHSLSVVRLAHERLRELGKLDTLQGLKFERGNRMIEDARIELTGNDQAAFESFRAKMLRNQAANAVFCNGRANIGADDAAVVNAFLAMYQELALSDPSKVFNGKDFFTLVYADRLAGVWRVRRLNRQGQKVDQEGKVLTDQQAEDLKIDVSEVKSYLTRAAENEHVALYFNEATLRGIDTVFTANLQTFVLADEGSIGNVMEQLFGRHRGVRELVEINGKMVIKDIYATSEEAARDFAAGKITREDMLREVAKGEGGKFTTQEQRTKNGKQVNNYKIYQALEIAFVDPSSSVLSSQLQAAEESLREAWASGDEEAFESAQKELARIQSAKEISVFELETILAENRLLSSQRSNYDGVRNAMEGTIRTHLIYLIATAKSAEAKEALHQELVRFEQKLAKDIQTQTLRGELATESLLGIVKNALARYRSIEANTELVKLLAKEQPAILAEIREQTRALEENMNDFLKDDKHLSLFARQEQRSATGEVTIRWIHVLTDRATGNVISSEDAGVVPLGATAQRDGLTGDYSFIAEDGKKLSISAERVGVVMARNPAEALVLINQWYRNDDFARFAPYGGRPDVAATAYQSKEDAAAMLATKMDTEPVAENKELSPDQKRVQIHDPSGLVDALFNWAKERGLIQGEYLTSGGSEVLSGFKSFRDALLRDPARAIGILEGLEVRGIIPESLKAELAAIKESTTGTLDREKQERLDLAILRLFQGLVDAGLPITQDALSDVFGILKEISTWLEGVSDAKITMRDIGRAIAEGREEWRAVFLKTLFARADATNARIIQLKALYGSLVTQYDAMQKVRAKQMRDEVRFTELSARILGALSTSKWKRLTQKLWAFRIYRTATPMDPSAKLIKRLFQKFPWRVSLRSALGRASHERQKLFKDSFKDIAKIMASKEWHDKTTVQTLVDALSELPEGQQATGADLAELYWGTAAGASSRMTHAAFIAKWAPIFEGLLALDRAGKVALSQITLRDIAKKGLLDKFEKMRRLPVFDDCSSENAAACTSDLLAITLEANNIVAGSWKQGWRRIQAWFEARYPAQYAVLSALSAIPDSLVSLWLKVRMAVAARFDIGKLSAGVAYLKPVIREGEPPNQDLAYRLWRDLRSNNKDQQKSAWETILAMQGKEWSRFGRKTRKSAEKAAREALSTPVKGEGNWIALSGRSKVGNVGVTHVRHLYVIAKTYQLPNVGRLVVIPETETTGRIAYAEHPELAPIGSVVSMETGKVTIEGTAYTAQARDERVETSVYRVSQLLGSAQEPSEIYVYRDKNEKEKRDNRYVYNEKRQTKKTNALLEQCRKGKTVRVRENYHSKDLRRKYQELLSRLDRRLPKEIRDAQKKFIESLPSGERTKYAAFLAVNAKRRALLEQRGGSQKFTPAMIEEIQKDHPGVSEKDVYAFLGISETVYRALKQAQDQISEQRGQIEADTKLNAKEKTHLLATLEGLDEMSRGVELNPDTEAYNSKGTFYLSIQMLQELNLFLQEFSPEEQPGAMRAYLQLYMIHEKIEKDLSDFQKILKWLEQDLKQQLEQSLEEQDIERLASLMARRAFLRRVQQKLGFQGKDDIGQAFRDFAAEMTSTYFLMKLMPDQGALAVKALRVMGQLKGNSLMGDKADFYTWRGLAAKDAWRSAQEGNLFSFEILQNYFRQSFSAHYYQVLEAISRGEFGIANSILDKKWNESRTVDGEPAIDYRTYVELKKLIHKARGEEIQVSRATNGPNKGEIEIKITGATPALPDEAMKEAFEMRSRLDRDLKDFMDLFSQRSELTKVHKAAEADIQKKTEEKAKELKTKFIGSGPEAWQEQRKKMEERSQGARDAFDTYKDMAHNPELREKFAAEANTFKTNVKKETGKYKLTGDDLENVKLVLMKVSDLPEELRRRAPEGLTEVLVGLVPLEEAPEFEKKAGDHKNALAWWEGPERFDSKTMLGRSGIMFVAAETLKDVETSGILDHEITHTGDLLTTERYEEERGAALSQGWFAESEMFREIKAYLGQHAEEIEKNPARLEQVLKHIRVEFESRSEGNYLDQYYDDEGIPKADREAQRASDLKKLDVMLAKVSAIMGYLGDSIATVQILQGLITPEQLAAFAALIPGVKSVAPADTAETETKPRSEVRDRDAVLHTAFENGKVTVQQIVPNYQFPKEMPRYHWATTPEEKAIMGNHIAYFGDEKKVIVINYEKVKDLPEAEMLQSLEIAMVHELIHAAGGTEVEAYTAQVEAMKKLAPDRFASQIDLIEALLALAQGNVSDIKIPELEKLQILANELLISKGDRAQIFEEILNRLQSQVYAIGNTP